MTIPTATEFGAWLKDARTARGLSVNALADRAGVSNASISKFETGKLNPRKRTAEQIAAALAPDNASSSAKDALVRAALASAGYATTPIRELERDPVFDEGFEAGYNSDDGLTDEDRENLRQEARDFYHFKAEQLRRQRGRA
ncbi:MAG: helix-turn-helix transcriptional regulator [Capsulimonas sp.]|uniref:helix-turn-helix domain-containing protein n=1 Tax=Capsulimonas sp. TaxID=2494211 RepID=UPI003265C8D8